MFEGRSVQLGQVRLVVRPSRGLGDNSSSYRVPYVPLEAKSPGADCVFLGSRSFLSSQIDLAIDLARQDGYTTIHEVEVQSCISDDRFVCPASSSASPTKYVWACNKVAKQGAGTPDLAPKEGQAVRTPQSPAVPPAVPAAPTTSPSTPPGKDNTGLVTVAIAAGVGVLAWLGIKQ